MRIRDDHRDVIMLMLIIIVVERDEREKDPYVRDRDISTLTQADRSCHDQEVCHLLIVMRRELGSGRIVLSFGSTRLEPRAI
jgi:hypothetical protein